MITNKLNEDSGVEQSIQGLIDEKIEEAKT